MAFGSHQELHGKTAICMGHWGHPKGSIVDLPSKLSPYRTCEIPSLTVLPSSPSPQNHIFRFQPGGMATLGSTNMAIMVYILFF